LYGNCCWKCLHFYTFQTFVILLNNLNTIYTTLYKNIGDFHVWSFGIWEENVFALFLIRIKNHNNFHLLFTLILHPPLVIAILATYLPNFFSPRTHLLVTISYPYPFPHSNCILMPLISEDDVFQNLHTVKLSFSSGPDLVPSCVVRKCADAL